MEETVRLLVALIAVVLALIVSNWFRDRRDRAKWKREWDRAADLDEMANSPGDFFEEHHE